MNAQVSKEYWIELLTKLLDWFSVELPSLILIILIFAFSIKFFNKLINKIRPFLLNRKYIEKSKNKQEAQKRINTLINIAQNTAQIILWIIFLMLVLSKIGIEIAPILAGAGIVGLAVGFGSQELVRDVISGFFMLLENQIRVGDVATINMTTGTVEKIELRTITLRDLAGTVHIFQNGKISTLSNQTKDWSAAVFEIGVAYKENVGMVVDIMRDVAMKLKEDEEFQDKILEDIEIMGLERFDNSAVVIKARIKTIPGAQWKIKREFQNRLKSKFDEENIEIPFPHTTLYWGEKTPPLKISMTEKNN